MVKFLTTLFQITETLPAYILFLMLVFQIQKIKIILEEKIVDYMSASADEASQELAPVDNLVYKKFVDNFNEVYSEKLNERQKELLTRYIASFSDNGLEFKLFLNEELGSLKENINSAINTKLAKENEDLKDKFVKISDILESFADNEFTDDNLNELIKIQSLVEELKENGN